jgi:hypothetical protein
LWMEAFAKVSPSSMKSPKWVGTHSVY